MQRVRTIGSRLPLRCQGGKRGGRHGSRGWDWFHNALEERKVLFKRFRRDVFFFSIIHLDTQTSQKPAKIPHVLHFRPLDPSTHTRKRVYFNFESEGENIGKITFELAVRFFFLIDDDADLR